MGIFSSPSQNVPGPSKEERDLLKERRRLAELQIETLEQERDALTMEKEREDVRVSGAREAIRRGLRGSASLLSGGYLGFTDDLGQRDTLGV